MPAPITFCSDLHLDLNPGLDKAFITAYKDFRGLLIIAGDVCNGVHLPLFRDTFSRLLEANQDVSIIFVMGNHDYYGGYTNYAQHVCDVRTLYATLQELGLLRD